MPRTNKSIDERFWEKVLPVPESGCWLWIGGLNNKGYGSFTANKVGGNAHRWAYMRYKGPIPTGLDLDHLCRTRSCVNPAHLEPVSRTVNHLRGCGTGTKESCPNGHFFDNRNTYKTKQGYRKCRACARERAQAWRDQRSGLHT